MTQTIVTDTAEQDAVYRRIAIRLIPFLMLCYLLAYIDRSNVGFAKLSLEQDIGITDAMFGIGAGLFYLGYIFMELPSNLMLAKVGARITLMRIMVLWGLFSAAFALVTAPWHFYMLRFLLGAAEAGFFPGVIFFLSCWVPTSRRARMTAMFMSAMAISGVVGGPLSGAIMHGMEGYAGMRGWQWLFIVEGLPSAFVGIIAYFYLANSPSEARWLSDREKAIVLADLEQEAAQKGPKAHGSFIDALRDPRYYCLAAFAAAQMSTIAGISLWMPSMLRHAGSENILHIGLLSALPYVVAVALQQYVARRSDRRQERRMHAALPMMMGGIAWLLMPIFATSLTGVVVLMTAATALVFATTGPFWAMPSAYLSRAAAAGGIAILTTFGSLFAFISPIIVGWSVTASGNMGWAQAYYGALMLVGGLILWIGARHRPEPQTTVKTI
jgi:MFS family permease